MITEQEKADNHSFTYLNNPSSGNPAWYYISSSDAGDSVFAYLIRAYAAPTKTDIDENSNEILPTEYNLSQNYPNPFNPVTTINYTIPSNVKRFTNSMTGEMSNVKLIVYDILGNEVATLVNEQQNQGNYQVKFDASNLSSGIYFYKLQAGNFVATKKMILLK
ncbi:MAG: hypothetical protein CR986_06050 [Ignavibacteriae bacterium]|nr:MAG: hypothetical protein CR986_06050 [Ignavibacteriota bacterium]